MRSLRLPPYNHLPRINWRDIWHDHRNWVIFSLVTFTLGALVVIWLLSMSLRLSRMREGLIHSVPDLVWIKDTEGSYI